MTLSLHARSHNLTFTGACIVRHCTLPPFSHKQHRDLSFDKQKRHVERQGQNRPFAANGLRNENLTALSTTLENDRFAVGVGFP